jgi:hypothetical protein
LHSAAPRPIVSTRPFRVFVAAVTQAGKQFDPRVPQADRPAGSDIAEKPAQTIGVTAARPGPYTFGERCAQCGDRVGR